MVDLLTSQGLALQERSCHDFDNLPLIIQKESEAFSNRQSLKQVGTLYRERDRLVEIC